MTQEHTQGAAELLGAASGVQLAVPISGIEAITRAEVDMQITTAKKYPRVISRFLARAEEMATVDVDTAASCLYTLNRGGKNIAGPSVRLAEIIASSWQNLRIDVRTESIGAEEVTAVSIAHDLENNVAVRKEVKRRITDKSGKRYNQDMILMTTNAAQSIAARNAIFTVVPRSYVDRIYNAAREVAAGSVKTMSEKRAHVITRLKTLVSDLTDERIFAALDGVAKIDDITQDHLDALIGLGTAVKQGDKTPEEAFPLPVAEQPRPTPPVKPKTPNDSGDTRPATPAQSEPQTPASDGQGAMFDDKK